MLGSWKHTVKLKETSLIQETTLFKVGIAWKIVKYYVSDGNNDCICIVNDYILVILQSIFLIWIN